MKPKNVAVIFTLISIVFFSCSKDQKYEKWLGDGTWTLTSNTLDGVEDAWGGSTSFTQTYNGCKVKDEDCAGSYEYTIEEGSGETIIGGSTFSYRIHEDGTKITFTYLTYTYDGNTRDCTDDCTLTWDILEMEKDRHVISTEDNNGSTWVRVFEKTS